MFCHLLLSWVWGFKDRFICPVFMCHLSFFLSWIPYLALAVLNLAFQKLEIFFTFISFNKKIHHHYCPLELNGWWIFTTRFLPIKFITVFLKLWLNLFHRKIKLNAFQRKTTNFKSAFQFGVKQLYTKAYFSAYCFKVSQSLLETNIYKQTKDIKPLILKQRYKPTYKQHKAENALEGHW